MQISNQKTSIKIYIACAFFCFFYLLFCWSGFSVAMSIIDLLQYIPYEKDENGNNVPDATGTYKILYRAYERGLLVISLADNILRIQPPLNIKPENLKKGFEIIKASIQDYLNGDIPDDVMKFRAGW